jgi:hypothetical protein
MTRAAIILLLAITMYGEAGVLRDDEAAMLVGHVMYNRVLAGTPWERVAAGFYGYARYAGQWIPAHYLALAERVLDRSGDPLSGAQYILSHGDVGRLVEEPACIRSLAIEQSGYRRRDGGFWRLYVYDRWPVTIGANAAPLCDPRFGADR